MSTNAPQHTIQGLTFFPIPDFNAAEQVFGPDKKQYFDRRNIPQVPKKYENIIQTLFFEGGRLPKMQPEIDRDKAHAAIRAWLVSFSPAHEAKVGTAAYALWLWCEGDLSTTK